MAVTDGSLAVLHPSHFALHSVRTGFIVNLLATRYIGAAMAMRRTVLQRALPLPPRTDLIAHDYWIAVVAEAFFRVRLLPEPLMLYRRHSSNASTGGSHSDRTIPKRIAVRVYTLAELARRRGQT